MKLRLHTKENFWTTHCIAAVVFVASFLISMPIEKVAAQQEVTLESFLEEEPSQQQLPTAQEDVIYNESDALPTIPSENIRSAPENYNSGFVNEDAAGLNLPQINQNLEQKSPEELAEEIRQESFDAAITGLFPLTPDQIQALLQEYDKTQRATETPAYGVPTPKINVANISLDPGVAPIKLITATGHITTVSMLDVTGAPWPIQDISWAGDFEVVEPEEGGNIMRITPMSIAAYGNMSIRLLNLKTPVTVMLSTSKDEVQYRVDAIVPEYGPFAEASIIDTGSSSNALVAGNVSVMGVLDGVVPNGAEKLQVGGTDGRTSAYKIGSQTYVRTPLTLLSPGWSQSVASADGMNVYVLEETPVLLLSDNGRFVRANLKAGRDFSNER